MEVYFAQVNGSNIEDFPALLFGVMLVYSYTVFVVIVQSFSIIGMLPDKIGSWIGVGPMGGVNPLQQVMALRSSFEGGAQQGAQGASSLGKAKGGSHTEDKANYMKKFQDHTGAKISGAMADRFTNTKAGLEFIRNAKTDADFERLTLGINGTSKDLAIKILRTSNDKISPEQKRSALNDFRDKWGGRRGNIMRAIKEGGIKDYNVNSDMRNSIISAEKAARKGDMSGMNSRGTVSFAKIYTEKAAGAAMNCQPVTALRYGAMAFVHRAVWQRFL